MQREIRLAGFGGQGMALAGFILGKAFALYAGLEAVMTQAYGPEARGGASSASVVVSDAQIDYPFVQHPDVLIAMSQEAYTTFYPTAKPDALILIDADLVTPEPHTAPLTIPVTRLAEGLGRRIVANVIMLGFFTAQTGLISRAALEQSLESTLKPKILQLNLRAFEIGLEYGRE